MNKRSESGWTLTLIKIVNDEIILPVSSPWRSLNIDESKGSWRP